jgi:hypothetical protein
LAVFTDPNLGGLRTRVQFRRQNDPRFTNAMVNLALNKAVTRLLIWIRNTTSIYTAQTFELTSGQYAGQFAMEYPLPVNTLWVDSLSFDGQQPLRLMSETELANTGIETSNGFGDPAAFYVYDMPNGQKVAVIYPRPGRVATLEFYGGIMPTPMVLDTDVPPFLPLYWDALETFAELYLIDGQEGMEDRYDFLWTKFLRERNEMKFISTLNRVYKTIRTRDIP